MADFSGCLFHDDVIEEFFSGPRMELELGYI
jgi:hypothetical protein